MARISELSLENFQGTSARQTLALGNFTLVFGENSAGKSSAARALLLLSQSLNERRWLFQGGSTKFLSFVGPQIDLAGFSNVVHKHDDSLMITIGLRIELDPNESLGEAHRGRRPTATNPIQASVAKLPFKAVSLESLVFEVTESRSGLESLKLGYFFRLEGKIEELTLDFAFGELARIDRVQESSRVATKAFLGLDPDDEFSLDLLSSFLFSTLGGWLSIRGPRTQDGVAMKRSELEVNLDNWFRIAKHFLNTALIAPVYIPGIRPIIQRVTFRDESDQESLKGKRLVHRKNAAANRYLGELTQGRYQIEHLTQNLGDAGFLGEVEVKLLRDTYLDVQVSFQDVGFGLGQILPVLNGIEDLRFEAGSGLMIVEQPELHLHPKMQAQLAQLMFESSANGGQIFAETHSEAMLLRIQKILRKQFEAKDALANVSVVYASFDPERGSTFQNMELRSDMDFILDFPNSFSELRLSELS